MPDMHLMLVDGKVVAVDLGPMLARHRAEVVRHRADAVAAAVDLLSNPAFSLGESYEAAESAMPGAMVNAAGNVALALAEAEHYGLLGE